MSHDQHRIRRSACQVICAAAIACLFAMKTHEFACAQDTPDGAPQAPYARQSLIDAAVGEAIDTFPEVDRGDVRAWIEGEEFATQRFLIVLETSPEQAHAMWQYRRQSLAAHFTELSPLYHEFEDAQEDFQRRVHEDPLFQRGEERQQAESPRDIARLQAYMASRRTGRISSAAFGPELRAEYDLLRWKLNADIAKARQDERRHFLEKVSGALTDYQTERLAAAENALQIGAPNDGVSGAPSRASTLIGGRMVSWFDSRLVLDPRIEVRGEVPAKVHEFRAVMLANAPELFTAAPGIAALVENYEARWADRLTRIDRLKLHESDPSADDLDAVRAELTSEMLDKTSSLWSVQLQQQIATILSDLASPEFAELWLAATDRMLHPGIYRRWDRIDEEFDRAIEAASSVASPNEDLLNALGALRTQYVEETDRLERRLLSGSRATMFVTPFNRHAATERDRDDINEFERLLQSAVERRTWFRGEIASLLQFDRG